jgi:hypothetical protein
MNGDRGRLLAGGFADITFPVRNWKRTELERGLEIDAAAALFPIPETCRVCAVATAAQFANLDLAGLRRGFRLGSSIRRRAARGGRVV